MSKKSGAKVWRPQETSPRDGNRLSWNRWRKKISGTGRF